MNGECRLPALSERPQNPDLSEEYRNWGTSRPRELKNKEEGGGEEKDGASRSSCSRNKADADQEFLELRFIIIIPFGLSQSLSVSLRLSFFVSVCLFYLCVSVFLCMSLSQPLYVHLCLCLFPSLCLLSVFLCLSNSHCLCLCLSFLVSVFLSLPVFFLFSFSLFNYLYMPLPNALSPTSPFSTPSSILPFSFVFPPFLYLCLILSLLHLPFTLPPSLLLRLPPFLPPSLLLVLSFYFLVRPQKSMHHCSREP